ncbi:hypothetical protein OIY81_131 [Cryptosporidium canis]|uniref:Uncharacterized protein n=1 Tax=Cryptosporidium canis TaxID=195482 RepID=A0ABQ8PB09_9CRYT|nr:hypothetical protein OJ252_412 [Cryptosporidium canis]KAJ1615101.1 hypothetical protein OIY81_131 [Cryptosporidium canis]
MGGSFKKLENISTQDKISQERYMKALDRERSNHASELAKKAEKLKLLYKTRFEEDLRAFMVSRKVNNNGYNLPNFRIGNPRILGVESSTTHKSKITPKATQQKFDVQKSPFVPTWAWPASLRNSENVRLISLFYTAETNIPLSPSQVGGNYNQLTKTSDVRQCTSKSCRNPLKTLKLSKKDDEERPIIQPITNPSGLIPSQRQKLRSKYGAPFTWIQDQSGNNLNVLSPLDKISEMSTPQSQVFTEIPKQPSIYPLELERKTLSCNSLNISEFIKKSRRMQKSLELLLNNNEPDSYIKSGITD